MPMHFWGLALPEARRAFIDMPAHSAYSGPGNQCLRQQLPALARPLARRHRQGRNVVRRRMAVPLRESIDAEHLAPTMTLRPVSPLRRSKARERVRPDCCGLLPGTKGMDIEA